MRRTWLGLALAATVALLGGSIAWAVEQARSPYPGHLRVAVPGGNGMMRGGGFGPGGSMMGGGMMRGGAMMGALWLRGDGVPVASIAAARQRAALAASPEGLHPGEIISFDNGFYVELKDATGNPATEVIVDPATGAVGTEPGPAMMWNTRYGMHGIVGGAPSTPAVPAEQAHQIAADWLVAAGTGQRAGTADAYPGYYTIDTTTTEGTIKGMLSVNAATGQVWYHTWHGRFIAREDT
jgi:hypothetical protein